jgi:hypothetical protein
MRSNLETYFNDVGSKPLLTREEEVILAKRIEKGDSNARKIMKYLHIHYQTQEKFTISSKNITKNLVVIQHTKNWLIY